MKIIILSPGMGKTINLVLESASKKFTIVTSTSEAIERTMKMAKDLHREIPRPITYSSFKSGAYRGDTKGFLIDDADQFLQSMTHIPIKTITLNKEDHEQ